MAAASRGAVATDVATNVFIAENVPLDRRRRRLNALTSRAIRGVNVRNAQSGAPRAFKLQSGLAAPKSNGLPVHQGEENARPHGRPSILEKTRNFSVRAWHVRAHLARGVVRGALGQLGAAASPLRTSTIHRGGITRLIQSNRWGPVDSEGSPWSLRVHPSRQSRGERTAVSSPLQLREIRRNRSCN